MRRRKIGAFYIVLSGVLFGTSPLIYYIAAILGSNSHTFLVIRCFLAVPVIGLILKKLRVPFRMPLRGVRDGLIASTIASSCTLLLTLSYNYLGGGMATTLHFLYPMCVMVISCLFYKSRINMMKVLALLLGLGGIALFSRGDSSVSPIGVILAVASAVVYSIYLVYLEHSAVHLLHPFQMGVLSNFTMGSMTLVYACQSRSFDVSGYSVLTLLFCLAAILALSVCAQALFQTGMLCIDATTSALLSTTEPITAVVVGILFMHEELTLSKFLGCVSILTGVILVIAGENRAIDEAEKNI